MSHFFRQQRFLSIWQLFHVEAEGRHSRFFWSIVVFRFSIREILWLTLVVAVGTCWFTEAARAKQWRRRAEIAAGQLEAENLGKMIFENKGVRIASPNRDPQYSEVFLPTNDVE